MDKLDFLDTGEPAETENDMPEQQALPPEPAPDPAEPNQAKVERHRGPDGKFAAKARDDEIMVPLKALHETRDEVRDLKARLARFDQPQQADFAPHIPDMFEDPDGYTEWQNQQMSRAIYAERYNTSLRFAEQQHGHEAVQQAVDWAAQRAAQDPQFNLAALSQPDPVAFALQQYQRERIVAEVDPGEKARAAVQAATEQLGRAERALADARQWSASADSELANLARAELPKAETAFAHARKALDDAIELAQRPPEAGTLSWQDMKSFRTMVSDAIAQAGPDRAGTAALRRLHSALSSDMERAAAEAGPRALQQLRRADRYMRGRQDRIDNVLSVVLGKTGEQSAEAAYAQINRWAQNQGGDFGKLARAIRSMPAEEADIVRASVFQRLGMKGGTDGEAAVFSPSQFAQNWNNMSQRAKAALFANTSHRKDIDELAAIMSAMKSPEQLANFSKEALSWNIGAHVGAAYVHPVATVLFGAGEWSAGKLLASPDFARILVGAAKMTPEAAYSAITEQLGVLATRQPGLAPAITNLTNYLAKVANDNFPAVSSAASPSREDQK